LKLLSYQCKFLPRSRPRPQNHGLGLKQLASIKVQQADIPPLQSATAGLCPIVCELLIISYPADVTSICATMFLAKLTNGHTKIVCLSVCLSVCLCVTHVLWLNHMP